MKAPLINKNWVAFEIASLYRLENLSGGVDLNSNGRIDDDEKITDKNQNGFLGDRPDWIDFFERHRLQLSAKGGLFRLFAQPETQNFPFSPDNPIHDLLSIETSELGIERVSKTYGFIAKVLAEVRNRFSKSKEQFPLQRDRFKLIYGVMVMKDLGITLEKQKDSFLTTAIERKGSDCDSSSYIVMAVAHEMGWKFTIMNAPRHVFVRGYEADGSHFNIDYGDIKPDKHYLSWLNPTKQNYSQNIYEATERALFANFLSLRGDAVSSPNDLKDYTRALELDPYNTLTRSNMAMSYFWTGRRKESLAELQKVREIDSNFSYLYEAYGVIDFEDGNIEEALENFDKSIKLDPSIPDKRLTQRRKNTLDRIEKRRPELEKIKQKYAAAENFYRDNKPNEAISELSDILKDRPKMIQAVTLRARCYLKKAEFENARKDFELALYIRPDHVDALLGRSSLSKQLGNFSEALADLQNIINIQPSSYEAYVQRAAIRHACHQLNMAQKDFDAAIKLNGSANGFEDKLKLFLEDKQKSAEALKQGRLSMQNQNYEEAKEALTRSIALDADLGEAYEERCRVYFIMGLIDEGFKDYQTALSFDPKFKDRVRQEILERSNALLQKRKENAAAINQNSPLDAMEVVFSEARRQIQENNFSEALIKLNWLAENKPHNSTVLAYRAYCHYMLKDYMHAQEDASNAINLAPRGPDAVNARITRGAARAGLEYFNDALRDFDMALEINPKNSMALAHKKATLDKIAREQTIHNLLASKSYSRVLELDPQNIEARSGLAYTRLANCNEKDTATLNAIVSDLDKTLSLDPEDKHHLVETNLYNLAFAYLKLGNLTAAFESIERIERKFSPPLDLYFFAGRALERVKNLENAKDVYRFVLAHRPKDERTRKALQIVEGKQRQALSLYQEGLATESEVLKSYETWQLHLKAIHEGKKGQVILDREKEWHDKTLSLLQKAVGQFSNSLHISPFSPDANRHRANCFLMLGKPREAQLDFQTAFYNETRSKKHK